MSRSPSRSDPGEKPTRESVVDRAFGILFAFRSPGERLTLSTLCVRTELPKPTVLRLVRQLQGWGALEREADGSYVLGLRLLELATLAPRGHVLRSIAMPYLEDLHAVTGEHVLLAVREGSESVLVERLSAPMAGRVLYRIGGRLPLHATGVGRVLLAFGPSELQEEILGTSLMLEPERVPIAESELRRALARIRHDGYATMRRDQPESMVSIAAPLVDATGRAQAAISVIVRPESSNLPQQIIPAVMTTARTISRVMSGSREVSVP